MREIEFGKQLIETEDIDPIYCELYRSSVPVEAKKDFLFAFFCYYHTGTASKVLESNTFWHGMYKGYDEKWKRGSSRRYFRGPKALAALHEFQDIYRGGGREAIDDLIEARTYKGVTELFEDWPMFGHMMNFKAPDMTNRSLPIGAAPMEFSWEDMALYDTCVDAAQRISYDLTGSRQAMNVPQVVDYLMENLGHLKAPPGYERTVNIQEIETVLCKYHQHFEGQYNVGRDIAKCLSSLARPTGYFSEEMAKHTPKLPKGYEE